MATFQLGVEHGCLTAGGRILLYIYPAGDCDSFNWPPRPDVDTRKTLGKLAGAIFDAIEMGDIPPKTEVLLPDGTPFDWQARLGDYTPPSMEGHWY